MKLTNPKVSRILLIAGLLVSQVKAEQPASLTVPLGASSAEIQQALDSLPDSGGEVILCSGVYLVTQPIALRRSNQTLRGSAGGTLLVLADQAQCPVIIMGEPVNQPLHVLSNLRVADLEIEGNRQHQASENWQGWVCGSDIRNNGITVQKVTDSSIEHVTTARCRSGGLVTTGYVRRLHVCNFTSMDNEFDGIACYCTEDSSFSDLRLHDNKAAGISFDLSASRNTISDSVLERNDLGIFMRDSRNNLYRNLVVRNCRKFGVFLAQSEGQTNAGWKPLPDTACTGNSFVALRISSCAGAAFRVNDPTCDGNLISDAQFSDNPKGLSVVAPNLVVVNSLLQE